MADFSCASTKRTSHWPAPMSWQAPVRFRVSVVVAALLLTGCNANQEVNLSSRTAPGAQGRSVLRSVTGPFSSPICDGRFGIPAGGNV